MTSSPKATSTTTTRRRFVMTSTGLVAASAGIKPTFPTRAQDAALPLGIVMSSSAVPGANDFTRDLMTSWGESRGVIVNVDFAQLVDMPARADRILRGGELRDIVELQELQPHRHVSNLVDVSFLADAVVSEQGDYLQWAKRTVSVYGSWMSLPIGGSATALMYRPSAMVAAGIKTAPADWNEYFEVASVLKESTGKPAGQPLAQTPVSAPAFCYSYMWSQGASEVMPNSREVSFSSEPLASALNVFQAAWSAGFAEESSTWDDGVLLKAFVASEISMAISNPELYLAARAAGDSDVKTAPVPAGPAGRFLPLGSRSLGISGRSAQPELAMEFLGWWTAQAQYSQWIVAQQGAIIPVTEPLMDLPFFAQDPNLTPFVESLEYGRVKGYSAAPSLASAEVAANYFVVNTFADVARGIDVKTAMDRAQLLMEQFYSQPQ